MVPRDAGRNRTNQLLRLWRLCLKTVLPLDMLGET